MNRRWLHTVGLRGCTGVFAASIVLLALAGCEATDAGRAAAKVASDALLPLVEPKLAGQYPEGFGVHGVAGDTQLLMIAVPVGTVGRTTGVHISHRRSGALLGEVAPPPGGWRVPLSLQIESFRDLGAGTAGSFLVLDGGGTPDDLGQAHATVSRFTYSFSPPAGFSAQWVSTHALPIDLLPGTANALPSGMLYAGGFLQLPDGTVLVSDAVLGAIWRADASLKRWTLAYLDPDLAAGRCSEFQGIGRAPGGGTRPYSMRLPNDLCPGIHSFTHVLPTDEVCMVRAAPPGGIWCLARRTLVDPLLPAPVKLALKRVLVPSQAGLSDLTDGLVYDRFHPDSPWVYWARAVSDAAGGGSNVLRRVNVHTGEIEVVASSNLLFDWTSNIAPLPPTGDDSRALTTLLLSVGQQENNAQVNTLLNGVDDFVAPTLLPVVEVPY